MRCLKNINMNHLGCRYSANKKACMTGELFREWLKWFGRHVGTGRQIVLLLGNCSGHAPGDITPPNMKIVFLPPNTTLKLQPYDQTTIINWFRKASHNDRGLLAWNDPLAEVTDLLDVIKVDMARVRPEHNSTLSTDVSHFISPSEEVMR